MRYLHTRDGNTDLTGQVHEVAELIVENGEIKVGDGVTVHENLKEIGGKVKKYTTTITNFSTNYHDLLPATENAFWNVQNIATKQVGGGVPLIDLTGDSRTIKPAFDVDGSYGSKVPLADINVSPSVSLLNESNQAEYFGSVGNTNEAFNVLNTPFSVWLASAGKPTAITITDGGEGYAVNDIITLTSGVIIQVTAINGSSVSEWIWQEGVAQLGTDTQNTTNGEGLGFACTVTEVQPYASYGLEISAAGSDYSAGRKEVWEDGGTIPIGYADITIDGGEVATVDLVSFFGTFGDLGSTFYIGEEPNGQGSNYSCEVTLVQIDETPHCGSLEVSIWATLEQITPDVDSNIYYDGNVVSIPNINNLAENFGVVYVDGVGNADSVSISIPNIKTLEYRTLTIKGCYGLTSIEFPTVLNCADIYDMTSNALTEASLIAIAEALIAGEQTDKTWSIQGYQNAWTSELETYISVLRGRGWTVTDND